MLEDNLNELQKGEIRRLEQNFKDVFCNEPGSTSVGEHCINTEPGKIVRTGGRNWPYHLKGKINKEVDEMLDLGVIEPSYGPWRSYPVMVPKADGSISLCIDFRKLNEISKFDAYPMAKIYDLLEKIGGTSVKDRG